MYIFGLKMWGQSMTTFTKGGLRWPNTQSGEETIMYANVTLGPKKAGGSV